MLAGGLNLARRIYEASSSCSHSQIDHIVGIKIVGVFLATRANTTRNAYFDEERRRGGNFLVTCCGRDRSS
jgi:hypothetical protein